MRFRLSEDNKMLVWSLSDFCKISAKTRKGMSLTGWLFWPVRKWKSWQCNSGMKSKARFKDNYCSTLHRIRSCFWNEFPKVWFQQIQSSAKRLRPGLVNFVCAVACHSCLSLPAAFTQPGQSLFAEPCKSLRMKVSNPPQWLSHCPSLRETKRIKLMPFAVQGIGRGGGGGCA